MLKIFLYSDNETSNTKTLNFGEIVSDFVKSKKSLFFKRISSS